MPSADGSGEGAGGGASEGAWTSGRCAGAERLSGRSQSHLSYSEEFHGGRHRWDAASSGGSRCDARMHTSLGDDGGGDGSEFLDA